MKEAKKRRMLVLFIGALGVVALCVGGRLAWDAYRQALQVRQAYAPPPDGMVLVPAGPFEMGSSEPGAEADEQPHRSVFVPAFYIDIYEVTNQQFKTVFPDHTFPEGAENVPATGVYKHQAEQYAAQLGKRLPTQAEWEKAARGTDGRRFPWGNTFDETRCNSRVPGGTKRPLLPVGSFPSGVSPYGCHDMSGNAWEWVSDVHVERSLLDGRWAMRRGILKGGAHGYSPFQARSSYNGFEAEDTTCNDVGFRCVRPAVPQSDGQ